MKEEKVYQGKINVIDEYEPGDGVYIGDNREPLAEMIQDDIEQYGNFLTVKYFISKTEKTKDELDKNEILKISGSAKADYGNAYSEYTGYLWTDEELNVGGHDLIEELNDHNGEYLYMEIEYSKQVV